MIWALIIIMAYIVFQTIRVIVRQQAHLDEWEMKNLMNGKIRKFPDDHNRVVAHLGQCEKCQQRLEEYNRGKELEDHLIE